MIKTTNFPTEVTMRRMMNHDPTYYDEFYDYDCCDPRYDCSDSDFKSDMRYDRDLNITTIYDLIDCRVMMIKESIDDKFEYIFKDFNFESLLLFYTDKLFIFSSTSKVFNNVYVMKNILEFIEGNVMVINALSLIVEIIHDFKQFDYCDCSKDLCYNTCRSNLYDIVEYNLKSFKKILKYKNNIIKLIHENALEIYENLSLKYGDELFLTSTKNNIDNIDSQLKTVENICHEVEIHYNRNYDYGDYKNESRDIYEESKDNINDNL